MRNPNGWGSVHKLPGNRRKPWRVRITAGWDVGEKGKGRQLFKTIGYYATREEAMTILAEYNADPTAFGDTATFREVYERFTPSKFPTISVENQKSYIYAYNTCSALHNMRFCDIRLVHLQSVIDNSGKNYPTLKKIKTLLTQMYEYALKYDIVNKNYADLIDIAQYKKEKASDDSEDDDNSGIHKPFTAKELEILWSNADRNIYVATILMLIYSGVRISDLLNLKKTSVNLDERWFRVNKSKTKAGTRLVPIAEKVVPFWEIWMAKEGDYVIQGERTPRINYSTYLDTYFRDVLTSIGIADHLPHDTRHTCISLMQRTDVSKLILKRIVGHKGQDVTDKVYTHTEISQLIEAINKI